MRIVNTLLSTLLTVIVGLCAGITSAESIKPVDLRCEYLVNPLGIDERKPRLSWRNESTQRGQMQSAYRLLVASSRDRLDADVGDLWDTGKVESDQSIHVAYEGKPMKSSMRCYWKVRVWDKEAKPSAWSETAMWSMGLLDPNEWQAKWIGLESGASDSTGKKLTLNPASWIWYPDGSPAKSAAAGNYFFCRAFQLPEGRKVKSAAVLFKADDAFVLWLNGKKVLHGNSWEVDETADISAGLIAGTNRLAVQATNGGDTPTPAGLIGVVQIEYENGPPMVVVTDSEWKVSEQEEQDWLKPEHSDTGWKNALTLGRYGIRPWSKNSPARQPSRELPARYVRREFEVSKKVERATAYLCGLGFSDLFINGQEVENDMMQPGLTRYDRRVLYVTHDVTNHLKAGTNAVGVILGNGRFFAPRLEKPAKFMDFGLPRMLFQMHIEYADGSEETVTSDASWKITDRGPIRANNEYDGEVYDARMEMPGWSAPGFHDDAWAVADEMSAPGGRLEAQMIEPMRVVQEIKPLSVTPLDKGGSIVDMGQVFYGNVRIRVSGPVGTTITLTSAYSLDEDGSLRVRDNRAAKCTDSYTLKGQGEEVWSPRFKGQGFRRFHVLGWPGEPTIDNFTGQVISMDVPVTGGFSCSDELVNQIYSNVRRTQQMYLRTVPMDPDRDERQGWIGDQNQNIHSFSYSWNIYPFFSKWLGDLRLDQLKNGQLPVVTPAYWEFYKNSMLWPSGVTLIPELLRRHYGDSEAIRENYTAMHKWMAYLEKQIDREGILPLGRYGDWCDVASAKSNTHRGVTPIPLLATAYLYRHCMLMEQFAEMQNLPADAKHYRELAERTKTAFNKNFLNVQSGEYQSDTQCAYAVAIMLDLVPPAHRERVVQNFIDSIVVDAGGHPSVGMVGMQWLFQALDQIGRNDVALSMLQKTTFPSWGYMVSQGATSVWEKWNSDTADAAMNSEGLLFLGGNINAWLFESVAGLRPDPTNPGFKHIVFKADPTMGNLTWAEAWHESLYGRISSAWKRDGDRFQWAVTVPVNTIATVYVPARQIEDITENGSSILKAQGVSFLRMDKDRAVLRVGSGSYEFVSKYHDAKFGG